MLNVLKNSVKYGIQIFVGALTTVAILLILDFSTAKLAGAQSQSNFPVLTQLKLKVAAVLQQPVTILDFNSGFGSSLTNGTLSLSVSGGGGGTVTSVTCGSGLTCTAANPIVGAGTIAITAPVSIGLGGTNSTTSLSGSTIMVSNGSAIVQGTAGTSTTVLHGNASGAPSFGSIVQGDVTNGYADLSSAQNIGGAKTFTANMITQAVTPGVDATYASATQSAAWSAVNSYNYGGKQQNLTCPVGGNLTVTVANGEYIRVTNPANSCGTITFTAGVAGEHITLNLTNSNAGQTFPNLASSITPAAFISGGYSAPTGSVTNLYTFVYDTTTAKWMQDAPQATNLQ